MASISIPDEIRVLAAAKYGSEVRSSLVNILTALNEDATILEEFAEKIGRKWSGEEFPPEEEEEEITNG